MRKYDFQVKIKDILTNHCTRRALEYWVQWLTRFYYIFVEKNKKDYSNKTISELFVRRDPDYKILIVGNVEQMNINEKEKILFYKNFNRFYNFIKQFHFKFDPTKLFSLFAHLVNAEENREEILLTNIYFWNNNYYNRQAKIAKKMWEVTAHKEEDRIQYFIECIEHLNEYTQPASEIKKKPINNKLKQKVWYNKFGNENNGYCPCGVSITIDDCDFGHIIAWACGGQTNENNLKPICKQCNCRMGIRNMDDYFNDKNMVF